MTQPSDQAVIRASVNVKLTTTTNIGLVGDVGAEKVATGEDGGAKVASDGGSHGALTTAWGANDAAMEGASCF